jgi:hypothetical protein
MAFIQVQQRRAIGRPAGEVRAGVSEVRGARLLTFIIGADAMAKAGMKRGDMLTLHRGTEADDGWVMITPGDDIETRTLGKVPNSPAGIVRFGLPADWPLTPCGSTEAPEWTARRGAITLRLPAALTSAKITPPRPAIPLAQPKIAESPPVTAKPAASGGGGDLRAEARRLFGMRQSVQQVARAVRLPVQELVRIEADVKAERAERAA